MAEMPETVVDKSYVSAALIPFTSHLTVEGFAAGKPPAKHKTEVSV